MASVCSFETSYAHTSTSPALARWAANRLPTAPHPTMQILIGRTLRRVPFSSGRALWRLLTGKETPGNIGQAFALAFADAISVLCVQANLAVAVDYLRVQREDHVFFQRNLALRADRWILQHGGANRVAGKMSQREAMLGESVGHGPMHVAG